jgi:hypothetical protein
MEAGESSSRDAAELCVACRPVAAAWRHIGHLVADRQTSSYLFADAEGGETNISQRL